jgi:hypothetical protein
MRPTALTPRAGRLDEYRTPCSPPMLTNTSDSAPHIYGRQIRYVVAGAGGFHNLHPVARGAPEPPGSFGALPEVTLEAYQDVAFGFLTVTVGPDDAHVAYSRLQHNRVQPFDSFSIMPNERRDRTKAPARS